MKFEAGTLTKGAYVEINGIEYPVHMPQYSGNTPLTPENLNKMQEDIFPVGSTYVTQSNTNPSTILGFGTWERVKGKVLIGLDEEDEDFDEIGKTGGNKVSEELNSGQATMGLTSDGTLGYEDRTIIRKTAVSGRGERSAEISLMNPYQVVGYMWIRTA